MAKNIPIDALRSFVTIAELGSFTLAGDKLARSQPAISLQIKKLETLVGQPLFHRKGHNFELSAAGNVLFRHATQILQLNDSALAELDPKTIQGKVRLGIPSEFATSLLPKIVGQFSRQNPQITLDVRCDLSRNLNNDIEQKKYDLILSLNDQAHQGADNEDIKQDKLVWVASPTYYDNGKHPVRLIVAPEGCIYRKRAIDILEQSHTPWQIIYTIMDLSGIKAAIEEGLGITVLAQSTLPDSLNVISIPNLASDLGYIGISLRTAEQDLSEATKALAEHIKQHLI